MIHEFDTVIYPFKIWITISSNLNEITEMFFDGETKKEFSFINTDNYEAMALPVIKKENREIGIVICFKKHKYMRVKQISHESCHAAKYLFEHIGADIDPHEPFEYVVGFIADCCDKVRRYKQAK
jgi:hypothetical protein